MNLSYSDACTAWQDFKKLVSDIVQKGDVHSIAEIGAGANPLFSINEIQEAGILYHLIDSSAEELKKAGEGYTIHVLDMQQEVTGLDQTFDLVIAQMTLEHIEQPELFFKNVHGILRRGGKVCLFFASVTNLPMIANKILPDFLTRRLLVLFQPFRNHENHGKFKAFYRWCFGPTRRNIRNFENAGFVVVRYVGYFGHSYYRRVPFLNYLEKRKTAFLLRHPNPYWCTYGQVVLLKDNN